MSSEVVKNRLTEVQINGNTEVRNIRILETLNGNKEYQKNGLTD